MNIKKQSAKKVFANHFYVDDLGRMVIVDEELLQTINGALVDMESYLGDSFNFWCDFINRDCENAKC